MGNPGQTGPNLKLNSDNAETLEFFEMHKNGNNANIGSLYSHAVLILTKSSKSKNQVVHEQKFKDLLTKLLPS